ncbi:MAG: hypothetical protein WCJ30_02890 [Deltaproteobacteria bacterium]
MRIVFTVFALGALLAGTPLLAQIPAALAAALALSACIATAGIATGSWSALAVATGALAAVSAAALAPVSPELAGAVMIVLLLAARSVRGRTDAIRGIAMLTALASGAASAAVVTHFAGAPIAIRAAAALVGGVIASLALLVPADDGVAWSLVHYAGEMPEAPRAVLLRAVALRRRVEGEIEGLGTNARRRLDRAWTSLEATTRSRLLARGATADVLDRRIASHVDALERAYAAADERFARTAGLDDKALHGVRLEADAMAAEASALAEVSEPDVDATPAEIRVLAD